MKIRYKLCALLLLEFWAIQKVQCQSVFGVEVGYGFPWAGDKISDGNIRSINEVSSEIEVINWSFGAGKNYTLSFSHFLNASIEAKIMVSYLDGSTVTRAVKLPNSNSSSNYKSNVFWLSPSLIFNLGKKSLRPYAYAGFMFGAGPKILDSRENIFQDQISESKYVLSGGAVYGISSGMGIKLYLKKNTNWCLSSEIRLISASYGPRKGTLVLYNINGVDQLNTLSTNDKKAIYKDQYVADYSLPENPDEPGIYSRRFYPFSSLGLNVGIFYIL